MLRAGVEGLARGRARRGHRRAGRRSRSRCSRAIPTRRAFDARLATRSTAGCGGVVCSVHEVDACARARVRTSSRSFPVCGSPTATRTIKRASARPEAVARAGARRARGRSRGHRGRRSARAPRSACHDAVATARHGAASASSVGVAQAVAQLRRGAVSLCCTAADSERARCTSVESHRLVASRRRPGGVTMANPPTLTPEQRQRALEKAAAARRQRAEVKDKLKIGSLTSRRAVRGDRPRRRERATCSRS